MPFMTYGLKKINVTEEVKAAAFGLLAKRFTTPKGTLIQLLSIYRTSSKGPDGGLDRYLEGGLVIILSAVHSKYHACGQPYYLNVMNTEVKEVLDLDNLTYHEDSYCARQAGQLQIKNLDNEGPGSTEYGAIYSRFNYQGFVKAQKEAEQKESEHKAIDKIIERVRNEK